MSSYPELLVKAAHLFLPTNAIGSNSETYHEDTVDEAEEWNEGVWDGITCYRLTIADIEHKSAHYQAGFIEGLRYRLLAPTEMLSPMITDPDHIQQHQAA